MLVSRVGMSTCMCWTRVRCWVRGREAWTSTNNTQEGRKTKGDEHPHSSKRKAKVKYIPTKGYAMTVMRAHSVVSGEVLRAEGTCLEGA